MVYLQQPDRRTPATDPDHRPPERALRRRHPTLALIALALATACGSDPGGPDAALVVALQAGDAQTDTVGRPLAAYAVRVTDSTGVPVAGVGVAWSVTSGGGGITPASTTDAAGIALAVRTLGTTAGVQTARATVGGATGSPVPFTATAVADAPATFEKVSGDAQTGAAGQPLGALYVVRARDQYANPISGATVQWSAAVGTLTAAASVTGASGTADNRHTLGGTAGTQQVTATLAASGLAPLTFTATATLTPTLVTTVGVPSNYGLHDTFVRDGLAFLSAWNTGVLIYDVGNGVAGGTPAAPQLVGTALTGTAPIGSRNAHNAWWFHNPNTSEKKYLFVGQEGPGSIGSSASGDIHVVDVSDLANPVEVASYHLDGAGAHNFWMDEQAQVLFAAYYNGGVVALDVSGTLSGSLAAREVARIQPGGAANTYVWGVQQAGGSVYAVDMESGFWQLTFTGSAFAVAGGGNNVPDRWSSDLWVHGTHAYTGTWGGIARNGNAGNAVKIWRLGAGGAPTLVDSLIVPGIGTVSDVEVSADGALLVFSAEGGANAGVHVYSLADPEKPVRLGSYLVGTGVHTASLADIGGKRYVFAAKNPGTPALLILDITAFGS